MAFLYLAMPSAWTTMANMTHMQWHFALLSLLVVANGRVASAIHAPNSNLITLGGSRRKISLYKPRSRTTLELSQGVS